MVYDNTSGFSSCNPLSQPKLFEIALLTLYRQPSFVLGGMRAVLSVDFDCRLSLVQNKINVWTTCPHFNTASLAEIERSIQSPRLIFFKSGCFH